uniref:Uncharacterized protein n=1 Tax=Cladonia uncialis subsp. uncialis TaxID=180999 RepID=A0A2K9YDU1_CLAUC|nr:hypothetical protein [Cladonia uncialis subsp. uncialis]
MFSSSVWSHFDLTAFNRPRALLLPESFSARYSARLRANEAKIAHPYKTLPSPSNTCSEGESNIPSSPETSRNNTRAQNERDESQIIIVLEQSPTDEKFNFVSSLNYKSLGTFNVVLEHPNAAKRNARYINLTHLELYPHPDRDALVLYNSSASDFCATGASSKQDHAGSPSNA